MSIYLKSALQNVDAHIQGLVDLRNQLAGMMGSIAIHPFGPPPPVPVDARHAAPSEIPESKIKSQKTPKPNGGGRKRKAESGSQKTERAVELTAMGEAMIKAGRRLREPFSATGLVADTRCTQKQASNAITRWLQKKWLVRSGHGEYTRTKAFGGGPESRSSEKLLAEIHSEIEAAKPKQD